MDAVQEVLNAAKSDLGLFERDATNKPVYFVAEIEQVFREVTTVLTGDTSDESSLGLDFHFHVSFAKLSTA